MNTTTTRNRRSEQLLTFLRDHDCTVRCSINQDGTLSVTGMVTECDGTVAEETTTIDATLRACRDWLGY